MTSIIDTLINLDTEYYLSLYKDVQSATKGMSEIDQKLWVLNHFIKYGYSEHRKYRLKTSKISDSHDEHTREHSKETPKEHSKETSKEHHRSRSHEHTHKQNTTPDSSSDSEKDVQELIKNFRQKHHKDTGGVRDKPDDKSIPVKNDPRLKRNFFWEIK